MDEVIWIEVLSRHRAVAARHRLAGRGTRIGRAYTNDVILDDPYVAPEHVHIVYEDDGSLVAEDLGSANGLFDAGGRKVARLALDDDASFRIGHTWLRLRKAAHGVAPERVIARDAGSWPAVAALTAAVLAIEALTLWLDDFSEPHATTYLIPLLAGIAGIAAWSAMWSAVARIFTGQSRFERNLLIALAGALGFEVVDAAAEIGAFGFSWIAFATYSYVAFFALIALVCFAHLREINPARSWLAGGVVTALLLGAVAVQAVVQSDARPGPGRSYVRTLLPPAMRLQPVNDEAKFFGAVETLQGKIDADRSEAP